MVIFLNVMSIVSEMWHQQCYGWIRRWCSLQWWHQRQQRQHPSHRCMLDSLTISSTCPMSIIDNNNNN